MTNLIAAETLERQVTKNPEELVRRRAEIEASTYMLLKVADVLGFFDDLGDEILQHIKEGYWGENHPKDQPRRR